MSTVVSPKPRNGYRAFDPVSEQQCGLVLEHLGQVLTSPVFRSSKRYAAVLRFVVEQALAGVEFLKERTIGATVFGRPPDYDTASDHVVRSAMGEVRKRLAQFYQEESEMVAVRIEAQPGSYVPLLWIAEGERTIVLETMPFHEPELVATPVAPAVRGRLGLWVKIACITLVATASALASFAIISERRPVNGFWGPLFDSPAGILICIGNKEGGSRAPASFDEPNKSTVRQFHHLASQTIHAADATTLARIAGFLAGYKKEYRIATQSEADFAALRNSPAVLIGLLNNNWTGQLVGKLRFSVERPEQGLIFIRDANDPAKKNWSIDYETPLLEVTKDFALVVRVLDPKTDQMVISVGGISALGTVAAGEFLTSERGLAELATLAPSGWRRMNLELVLSTQVIRGKSGRAKIEAVHFW